MEATLPQACPSSTGVLAMLRRALSGNPCAAYKRCPWRDEANERLLFHGTGATKPLARRGSEEVVEHEQGLDSRLVTGGV